MNQLFRIEISGELPEGDHDMGAHAHVAAVKPVAELVKALSDMGLLNVTKHIRVLRQKAPVPAAKPVKLSEVPPAA